MNLAHNSKYKKQRKKLNDRLKRWIEDTNDDYLKTMRTYNKEIEVFDGEGRYIAPGFIDIHFHGAAGSDTMDGNIRALSHIKETVIHSGVTSFLATTMTMPI